MRSIPSRLAAKAKDYGRILRARASQARARLEAARFPDRPWHQVLNDTSVDRYPAVFRFAATILPGGRPDPLRVLSFGCSTGEECISLRRYLPTARIVGTDISERNLRICRRRINDSNTAFVAADEGHLGTEAPFDAIFAMSVLCRHPDTKDRHNIVDLYPFELFEGALRTLDALLAVGGYLFIYNANYRFLDAACAARYRAIAVPGVIESGFVTLFEPDGTRAPNQSPQPVAFLKLG